MRPALDSGVRLASVLHAAPVPAPLFFPKGRGLNSDPGPTCPSSPTASLGAGASAHRNTQILSWASPEAHYHVGLFPREQTDFRSWIERSTMPILRAAARSAITSIHISF